MIRQLAAGLVIALIAGAGLAHPLAPALLQLQEQGPGVFSVLWRTSVARVSEGEVMPVLPANCTTVGEARNDSSRGSSFEQRSFVSCEGGISGRALSVSNLDATGINVVIRIERSSGRVVNGLLDAGQLSFTIPQEQSAKEVIADYVGLGVQHLLNGFDHLLFIVGLFFLVSGWKRLLGTVTAFTVGHSLTLALATLGYVEVNATVAEAGIALSLLVLAVELARPNPSAWIRRRPWDMAVAFGLLHGLGFAGALSGTGLPGDAIPAALLGFNLGIEAGQVAVIAALLLLFQAWRMTVGRDYRPDVRRHGNAGLQGTSAGLQESVIKSSDSLYFLAVYVMGTLAAFWLYQRLAVVVV